MRKKQNFQTCVMCGSPKNLESQHSNRVQKSYFQKWRNKCSTVICRLLQLDSPSYEDLFINQPICDSCAYIFRQVEMSYDSLTKAEKSLLESMQRLKTRLKAQYDSCVLLDTKKIDNLKEKIRKGETNFNGDSVEIAQLLWHGELNTLRIKITVIYISSFDFNGLGIHLETTAAQPVRLCDCANQNTEKIEATITDYLISRISKCEEQAKDDNHSDISENPDDWVQISDMNDSGSIIDNESDCESNKRTEGSKEGDSSDMSMSEKSQLTNKSAEGIGMGGNESGDSKWIKCDVKNCKVSFRKEFQLQNHIRKSHDGMYELL